MLGLHIKKKGIKWYSIVLAKQYIVVIVGGPVLDKNNHVVGYIDRGNKKGEKEEEYNAFCPITHLLEIIDYSK